MSAPVCVVYFGLRYEIGEDEIEALEQRQDSRQRQARAVGLKSYWGNFGAAEPRYVLLVGTEIGLLGPENRLSLTVQLDQLAGAIDRTRRQIDSADLRGEIGLHAEFLLD